MALGERLPRPPAGRRPLALGLDGTLLDTKPRQLAALAALLGAERSEELDGERLWALVRDGLTTREALHRLGLGAAQVAELGARLEATAEEPGWLALDRPFDGVPAALEALAAGGEPRPVILTARRHQDRAREQVSALGLLEWCEKVAVVSLAAGGEAKAAQLTALGCRGLVGDSEDDASAAALAGVPFAAVTTGRRAGEFLRTRGYAAFDSLSAALGAL